MINTVLGLKHKYKLDEKDIKRLEYIDQGLHHVHKEEGDDRLLEIYEELSDHEKNMLFRNL